MKIQQLALALASGGTVFAVQAQSTVTVYGGVDASLTTTQSGTGTTLPGGSVAAGPQQNLHRLESGVGPGARIGLRGSEDLGGGLSSGFVAEIGIAIDTGAQQQGGLAFGRQIHVGLQGRNWSLSAGRQYSPFHWAMAVGDAMDAVYWGNAYGAVGFYIYNSVGEAAGSGFYQAPARVDNSLLGSFKSGGFTGRLMIGFGNENLRGTGRLVNPSIEYRAGALTLAASTVRFKQGAAAITATASPATLRDHIATASYDLGGGVRIAGGWLRMDGAPAANATPAATVGAAGASPFSYGWRKAEGLFIGASVPFGAHRVVATVTQMRYELGSLPQGRSLVAGIAYDHALSKRTRLYASYGQVDNNATARTPLFASVVAVTPNGFGSDPRALSLGVRHTF